MNPTNSIAVETGEYLSGCSGSPKCVLVTRNDYLPLWVHNQEVVDVYRYVHHAIRVAQNMGEGRGDELE